MGKKTKVVVDTNVIVSAFGWHGKPEEIIRLIVKGRLINFITAEILNELRRVIGYPKFDFSEELQAEILETMFCISTFTETDETIVVVKEDPPDNRILECAISAGAEFVISGDKHLLNLTDFMGIKILTPDSFLEVRGYP